MSVFLSTFINKIDKKGRVSVPAPFRSILTQQGGDGAVFFPSFKLSCIEGCGLARIEKIRDSLDTSFDIFSDAQNDLATTLFSNAHFVNFDTEGRMILPAVLLEVGQLTDDVCFVGAGSTFQLWQPALFQQHQTAARIRAQEQKLSIKLG
jgi:MraZ protein